MMLAKKKLFAYRNGYKARVAGVVVGDNPYPETSPLHWEWMVGWVDAAEKQHFQLPRKGVR